MNGRTAAARVPGAERVDGVTYKVPLRNGQSITIPSPPRVYYSAAGVARVKEELAWATTKTVVSTTATKTSICARPPFVQADYGIQVFDNPEFGQVRMVDYKGTLYAVGIDVARALDYANPSKAVLDHCKGVSKLGIPSAGGQQETNCIPEGDIYRLIIKAADQSKNLSIKKKAERFEHWIFDEVLPAIRKHGAYMTPATIEAVLTDPDFIIRLATQLKDEQTKNKVLTAKIEADQPYVPTTQTDNGVQIFQSPEFGQIRAIEVNGEPWLVGKDVATALGYSDA